MTTSTISLADVETAFSDYDFSRVESPSIEPRTLIWMEVNRIGTLISEASPDAAKNLETLCAQLEYIGLFPPGFEMRAYVDVTPQAVLFGKLIELFILQQTLPAEPNLRQLLDIWRAAEPHSRLFLYLLAEQHFQADQAEEALHFINQAINLNNVCVGCQRLLENIARKFPKIFDTPSQLSDVQEYLKDRFCHVPFQYISSGWEGKTFACSCPAWVPYPTGNILEAQSPKEVWNSPAALKIRQSILDGTFQYCSRTLCSPIRNRQLPKRENFLKSPLGHQILANNPVVSTPPRYVELNHDNSCNLACPSCRSEVRMAKAAENDLFSKAADTTILPLLKQVNGMAYITGGGEPFASRHYRDLLLRLQPEEFPKLGLILMSNAQLIHEEMWKDFAHIQPLLRSFSISIDAATPATYEKVRRPGKWENLLRGMNFLSGLRARNAIPFLQMNFVVQEENYREIHDFIRLGEQWGVDLIWFQRMANYGSFSAAEFHNQDLCRPDHPEHVKLIETLSDPRMHSPIVDTHMFNNLLPSVFLRPPRFPRFDISLWQTEELT